MISPADPTAVSSADDATGHLLVRYGAIPQAALYTVDTAEIEHIKRGTAVVIMTDRGQELGEVLDIIPAALSKSHQPAGPIERTATSDDHNLYLKRRQQAAGSFQVWHRRIQEWNLELELMEIERTLDDEKQILYVLNERGAETTRLALLAAAAGFGIVSVQPVDADGPVDGMAGGCGTACGCG
ncbi:MAG: hypothetical protein MK110_16920 [Fuerstiella sp.]|nr:hypothetical protein [Fuerstiella sp.]